MPISSRILETNHTAFTYTNLSEGLSYRFMITIGRYTNALSSRILCIMFHQLLLKAQILEKKRLHAEGDEILQWTPIPRAEWGT